MHCRLPITLVRVLALATLALSAGPAGVVTAYAAEPGEEITITAPRAVKQRVGTTPGRGPIEDISLVRKINVAGLDLRNSDVAAEVAKKIRDTAKESCDQMNVLYPDTTYPAVGEEKNCVDEAVQDALAQLKALIAGAS